MSAVAWIILGIMFVGLVSSWVIVMGVDPRQWKGGDKRDQNK